MEATSDIAVLQTNKFILQNEIGEGSYGKVYRAIRVIDETRAAEVACKVIETASSPRKYLTKFLPRELDILIRVNHPHIIHVTDIYQRRTRFFIFMRIGENGDLLGYISKHGPVSEAQCRVWMRQMISALQYLHALNIVHRDLKCENILITRNYNVKISDFGFARNVRGPAGDVLSETYCGSLLYAAPEVLKGVPYLPKQADIWSMGVILYAMLNKAMPFTENSAKALFGKQALVELYLMLYIHPIIYVSSKVQKQWRFRTTVVNNLSSECKELVTAMINPDPQARPTAGEVFKGPWIGMEPRLLKLTDLEESLLKNATDYDFEMRRKRRQEPDLINVTEIDKKGVLRKLKCTDFQEYFKTSGPFEQGNINLNESYHTLT